MTAQSRGRQNRQPVSMHDCCIPLWLLLNAPSVLGLITMLAQLTPPFGCSCRASTESLEAGHLLCVLISG